MDVIKPIMEVIEFSFTVSYQQQQQVQESTNKDSPQHQQSWFQDIERLMKSFKTHRSALDFHKAFLVGSLHVTNEEHR